ncbi:MAG: T9SS type A sorting domain-containing protein [Caldithrix sp.]|nr:MAG: T9SS type A sorting domain-containing protein [Caldithrix sp.]
MFRTTCSLLATLLTMTPWTIAPLPAQDLSGLSICIDPGHGKNVPNAGPTGLRESDLNVAVTFFLKDFLKSANIDTVLLTRVDDSTNPTLSQREAIANSFGVDWFHSVHHNAFNANNRFTLMLYEEERTAAQRCADGRDMGTGNPDWPGQSDTMSKLMAATIFSALRTSNFIDRLDWTFFGSCNGGFSLGVLNNLIMPGELSEATFHDNRIEENKLRNEDFLRLEARALFMSILDFYEAGKMTTGVLSGIVRDDGTGEPVNGAQFTLLPLQLNYTTDEHGNGFYAFHDLAPGDYEVSVAANGFDGTTKTITITAHDFSFADFSLQSARPPVVELTLPAPGAVDVSVYDEIGVRFSRSMNRQSVEDAFAIGPGTVGHFIWNTPSTTLLFEPDTRFKFDTEFTVTIAGTAIDEAGRPLDGNRDGTGGDAFFYDFTTEPLDNTRPVVLDFFPTQRDTGVFLREVSWARFNRELDPASVNENTVLLTESGQSIPAQVDYVGDALHTVTIVPLEPLAPNRRHFVTFTTGIQLPDGTPLSSPFKWPFTTQVENATITLWDDFENGLLWAQPAASAITREIVADSTILSLTERNFISGSRAGELHYEFSGDSGLVHIARFEAAVVAVNATGALGFYLYGDNSGNEVRVALEDLDGFENLPWRSINWAGWRLLQFDLRDVDLTPGMNGNGVLDGEFAKIAAVEVRFAGSPKGTILLEDFFNSTPGTPVFVEIPHDGATRPREFILSQNYPNPFNPETIIRYNIPRTLRATAQVTLAIYNLNGQLVRKLVDELQSPGAHRVTWDGLDKTGRLAPSGIYVYRIQVGAFEESKRMIFLK